MALPAAKKLIDRAKSGERLNHKERRHAVAFIMATDPGMSNTDMAEMFGISERMIRFDRKAIREEIAKECQNLDPALIVGDILVNRDRVIAGIEGSLKEARKGTRTYIEHLLALHRVVSETTHTLQDLGALPKELGHLQVDSYKFQAYVIKDNQVETRRVDMFPDGKSQPQLSDAQDRAALDAEYLDVVKMPALPMPKQANAPQDESVSAEGGNAAGREPTPQD